MQTTGFKTKRQRVYEIKSLKHYLDWYIWYKHIHLYIFFGEYEFWVRYMSIVRWLQFKYQYVKQYFRTQTINALYPRVTGYKILDTSTSLLFMHSSHSNICITLNSPVGLFLIAYFKSCNKTMLRFVYIQQGSFSSTGLHISQTTLRNIWNLDVQIAFLKHNIV